MIQLRVEYVYDGGVEPRGFAVPALHIVGSSDTRTLAVKAIAAIAFALGDADDPTPVVPGAEIEALNVTVRPPSAAQVNSISAPGARPRVLQHSSMVVAAIRKSFLMPEGDCAAEANLIESKEES